MQRRPKRQRPSLGTAGRPISKPRVFAFVSQVNTSFLTADRFGQLYKYHNDFFTVLDRPLYLLMRFQYRGKSQGIKGTILPDSDRIVPRKMFSDSCSPPCPGMQYNKEGRRRLQILPKASIFLQIPAVGSDGYRPKQIPALCSIIRRAICVGGGINPRVIGDAAAIARASPADLPRRYAKELFELLGKITCRWKSASLTDLRH